MKILFICDGNVARSQEAEIFLNTFAKGKHQALSAGVNPTVGKPIDPLVIEVMKEQGNDMDRSVRKPIDEAVARDANLIVSFKPTDELPDFVRKLNNIRYWNVADPRGQSLEFHRQTRDIVRSKVESLINEL